MTKILGKIFYYIKNFVLPVLFIATIYIVLMMFQRLGKQPFGSNFFEFIEVILPYILLITLLLIDTFLKQDEVRDNFFYNITSFLAIATIFIFCYRAIFDKNLILWHKLKYDIDFNYFTDQIAPMKTILYLLSAANIMLIVRGHIKDNQELEKVTEVKEDNFKIEESFDDNFVIDNHEESFETDKYDYEQVINKKEEVKVNNNNRNNNNQHKNKNYYYNNNKNKKNNYYKKNNNYYKNNNKPKNNTQNNNNNNQNKTKKSFDFYE